VPQYTCIESCYDSQRGELFEKGKSYEIAHAHPLIGYFDCDAGKKARDEKRAKIAKLQAASAARAKAEAKRAPVPADDDGENQLDLSK
jgi:hypothetical protein